MLFSGDMFIKTLNGTKTQTRRLSGRKAAGEGIPGEQLLIPGQSLHYLNKTGTRWCIKWEVGRTYSVQPGRGKVTAWYNPRTNMIETDPLTPGSQLAASLLGYIPGRIRITNIREEDVRYITLEDAIAEGFDDQKGFWTKWCSMHDKGALKVDAGTNRGARLSWDDMDADIACTWLWTRHTPKYQAYPLNFERVIPEGYHVSL